MSSAEKHTPNRGDMEEAFAFAAQFLDDGSLGGTVDCRWADYPDTSIVRAMAVILVGMTRNP